MFSKRLDGEAEAAIAKSLKMEEPQKEIGPQKKERRTLEGLKEN
jgi:hypothetical protein